MGKSVPTYRQELRNLFREWKDFKRALRDREKDAFDRLMISAEKYASAGQYQANPDPVETMLISILLEHQMMIERILRRLVDERMDIGSISRPPQEEDGCLDKDS